MKKYVFIIRDKKLGSYYEPLFKVEDKEHVVEMTIRSLARIPEGQRVIARDQALYYMGTFDDIECSFDLLPQPEKLLDYEDYLLKGDDNGKA